MHLVISQQDHKSLISHLHAGDGLESAAILLCSFSEFDGRKKICCRQTFLIPDEECARTERSISWPSEQIDRALDAAIAADMLPILIHSHPNGFWGFSDVDDNSDVEIIPYLQEENRWNIAGSAVMMPDGRVLCRLYEDQKPAKYLDSVKIIGSDLKFYFVDGKTNDGLAYGSEMTDVFKRLSVCIVGVSGTGSIIAEQAGRLGFGELILIDPDKIEKRNLNRIVSASTRHAEESWDKPKVAGDAVRSYRDDVNVVELPTDIASHETVLRAAHADIMLCCVDSAKGRMICDLIAAYFMVPLIDMGVTIPVTTSETNAEIADVIGRVDFVHPESSSLRDRGVYDQNMLRAEALRLNAPEQYDQELREGYISGVHEEAPSVISLNMQAAALAMNELIARCFPVRFEHSAEYARTVFSLCAMEHEYLSDEELGPRHSPAVLAAGDAAPLLGLPALEDQRQRVTT
jgi:hypothetical protein